MLQTDAHIAVSLASVDQTVWHGLASTHVSSGVVHPLQCSERQRSRGDWCFTARDSRQLYAKAVPSVYAWRA